MTDYAGIDYSAGTGTNKDPETGIRYGVISHRSIDPDALNEIYISEHSKDMAFESWKKEVGEAVQSALRDLMGTRGAQFFSEQVLDGDIGDYYQGDEVDPLYDDGIHRITKCLNADLMVLKSPYYTYAQFCSPCVPGACNLDVPLSPDFLRHGNKCYCLGHDWFENGIAPYQVFDVAGSLILGGKNNYE